MDDEERPPKAETPRPGILQAWRFWAPRAVLEAGLIVLSLLLAFWLSDWQDRRRLEREVRETRTALIEEIRANRDMLRSPTYLPHHERLRRRLETVALNDEADLGELREAGYGIFQTGIHFPEFRDTAWRTAQTTGVVQHMDRAEVFALTDVYAAQDRAETTVMAYYPSILSLPASADDPARLRGALLGVVLFMGDLHGGEQVIVRLQGEALAALGVEDPSPEEEQGAAS